MTDIANATTADGVAGRRINMPAAYAFSDLAFHLVLRIARSPPETSWVVSIRLRIAPHVPIAIVVVARTGDHLAFVMLDRRNFIGCRRCFFLRGLQVQRCDLLRRDRLIDRGAGMGMLR